MDNSTRTDLVTSAPIVLDPVTDYVRQVNLLIIYVILDGLFSFLGIGANIINISVFVRQGFKDSINISLLGLSISDFVNSVTLFGASCFDNPLSEDMDLPIEPIGISYLTVDYPHWCMSRVTSFITAFITFERCLCIAMPLKVKIIITPFRTKVIIAYIFASVIILFCPVYFVRKIEWEYNILSNRTILGVTFTNDIEIVETVTFFIHGVFLSTALLLSVAICTIILVVKLNQKTKWREESVAQTASKQEEVSVKEKKVVKMITLISTIFIVCYFPATVLFLAMAIYPEFSIGGKYENLLYVTWSVPFVLDSINSSVNILVYFNMSTKYRVTLKKIAGELSQKMCSSESKKGKEINSNKRAWLKQPPIKENKIQ